MAQYYLMSQLPSLDGIGDNTPIPITEERFIELCDQFAGKRVQKELKGLTLTPPRTPEKSSSALIQAWNEGERKLRLALAKVRADKLKKPFDVGNEYLPIELIKAAGTAVETENPLEAEKYLSRYRLEFLETLRPMDGFSDEAVFYYGLKLKLILRIRQFEADKGNTAYRNIYTSIMNGDRSEVRQ